MTSRVTQLRDDIRRLHQALDATAASIGDVEDHFRFTIATELDERSALRGQQSIAERVANRVTLETFDDLVRGLPRPR